MLPSINELSSQQTRPTQDTNKIVSNLMDYSSTYKYVTIRYHASDMQVYIDSDAACLVLLKANSRGTCHLYFSSTLNNMKTIPAPVYNNPILT